jgi:hypothetical protein
MSGNVRADDGPGIISDALRCESAAAGVDDGTILAEAHASRERAGLPCQVHAVYAQAEPIAAARSGDSHAAGYSAVRGLDMAGQFRAGTCDRLARHLVEAPASIPRAGSAASIPSGSRRNGTVTAVSVPATRRQR